MKSIQAILLILIAMIAGASRVAGQGTAFTYQGLLRDNGVPANGSYQMTFSLWIAPSGGLLIGGPVTNSFTLTNGLFSVVLDFGSLFPGADRYLEIGVRTNGGGSFTNLAGRQKLTAVPYAVTASNLTGTVPANGLSGAYSGAVSFTNTGNQFSGNGGGLTNLSGIGTTNFTGSLAGDVTGTQSATVVANVGGQTAANVAAGAVAANAAATNNSANSIVKRDGLGGFVAGNLVLPFTTASNGILYLGGTPSFHSFGPNNTFVGQNAGNLTLTGANNTAAGVGALTLLSTGTENVAIGAFAMNSNTIGSDNIAIGEHALYDNKSGGQNIGIGSFALENATGNSNIAIGNLAGLQVTTGSRNILIGNQGVIAGDDSTIRIGSQTTQSRAFIAGISGVTVSGGVAVSILGTGQLGTITSSARFKTDIENMDEASDVLLSLRPVTFHYKPELDPKGLAQFGLIAEEVEKLDPDLVVRDDKNQPYSVRYEAVNAMLLNEFLKQYRKVEEQAREIEGLKKKTDSVERLEERLTRLEKLLAERL